MLKNRIHSYFILNTVIIQFISATILKNRNLIAEQSCAQKFRFCSTCDLDLKQCLSCVQGFLLSVDGVCQSLCSNSLFLNNFNLENNDDLNCVSVCDVGFEANQLHGVCEQIQQCPIYTTQNYFFHQSDIQEVLYVGNQVFVSLDISSTLYFWKYSEPVVNIFILPLYDQQYMKSMQKSSNSSKFWVWSDYSLISVSISTMKIADVYKINLADFSLPKEMILFEGDNNSLNVVMLNQQQTLICMINLIKQNYDHCIKNELQIWPNIPHSSESFYFSIIYLNEILVYDSTDLSKSYSNKLQTPKYIIRIQQFKDGNIQFVTVDNNSLSFFISSFAYNLNQAPVYFENYSQNQSLSMGFNLIFETKNIILNAYQNLTLYSYMLDKTNKIATFQTLSYLPCYVSYKAQNYTCNQLISYDYFVLNSQTVNIALVYSYKGDEQIFLQLIIQVDLMSNTISYLYADVDAQNKIRFINQNSFLVFCFSEIQTKKFSSNPKRFLEQKESRLMQQANLSVANYAHNSNITLLLFLQKDNNELLNYNRQIQTSIKLQIEMSRLSQSKTMLTDEKQLIIRGGQNLFYIYDSISGNLLYQTSIDGKVLDCIVIGQKLLIFNSQKLLTFQVLKYSIQLISNYSLSFTQTNFMSIVNIEDSIYLYSQSQIMLIDLQFLLIQQQNQFSYTLLNIVSLSFLIKFNKFYLTQQTEGMEIFVILDSNLQQLNQFDFTQYILTFSSDDGQAILVQKNFNSFIYDPNLQKQIFQSFVLPYKPLVLLYNQQQIIVIEDSKISIFHLSLLAIIRQLENSCFFGLEKLYFNSVLQKLIIKQKSNKVNQISSINLNTGSIEQIFNMDSQDQYIIFNELNTNTLFYFTSKGLNKINLFREKYQYYEINFETSSDLTSCDFEIDQSNLYIMAYFCKDDSNYFIQFMNIMNKSILSSYGGAALDYLEVKPLININSVAIITSIGFQIIDLGQQIQIFDLDLFGSLEYSYFNFFDYLKKSKQIIFSYDSTLEIHQYNGTSSGFTQVCKLSLDIIQVFTDILIIDEEEEIIFLLTQFIQNESYLPIIQIIQQFNITSCSILSQGQLFKADDPFTFQKNQELNSLEQIIILVNPSQVLAAIFIGQQFYQTVFYCTSLFIATDYFYIFYNDILTASSRTPSELNKVYLTLSVNQIPIYVSYSENQIYIISSSMIEVFDINLKKGLMQVKSSFQIQSVFTLADETSILLISPFGDFAIFDSKTLKFIQQLKFSSMQKIPTKIKYYPSSNLLVLTCQNIMYQIDLNYIYDFQKSIMLTNFNKILALNPQQLYEQNINSEQISIYLFDTKQDLWLYSQNKQFQLIGTYYGQSMIQYLIYGKSNGILIGFRSYFVFIKGNQEQKFYRNDSLIGIDILIQDRYFILQNQRRNIYEIVANSNQFNSQLFYSIDQNDSSTIAWFIISSNNLIIVYTSQNQLIANNTLIYDFNLYFQIYSNLQFLELILADGNNNCFAVAFSNFFFVYYYQSRLDNQIINLSFYQIYSSINNLENGFLINKLLMFQSTVYFTITNNRVCIALSLPLQVIKLQPESISFINYTILISHSNYLDFQQNYQQNLQTSLLISPCSNRQKKIFVNKYVSILFCKYSINVYLKKADTFQFIQVYQMFGLIEIFNIQNTNLLILRSTDELHVLYYSSEKQKLIKQNIIQQKTEKIIQIELVDSIKQQENQKNVILPNSVLNMKALLQDQLISFQIVLPLYYDKQGSYVSELKDSINSLTCYQNYDTGLQNEILSYQIEQIQQSISQIGQYFYISSIFLKLPSIGQQRIKREQLDLIINSNLQVQQNFISEFTFYSLDQKNAEPISLQRFFNYNITSLKMKNVSIFFSNKSEIKPSMALIFLKMDQIYIQSIQNFSKVNLQSLNTLIISGMTIENINFASNQLFLFQNISTIFLKNIVIRNVSGFTQNLITIKQAGQIIIDGLYLSDINNLDFESIFNINNSLDIQINNFTISNVISKQENGSTIFNTSLINQITVTKLKAEHLLNISIHKSMHYDRIDNILQILSKDIISYLDIQINNCTQYAALFNILSNHVSFYSCSVSNIYSFNSYGSFLFYSGGEFQIINSNFTNNTALEGGSIYLLNSQINSLIDNCIFMSCSSQGRGGAIFLDSTFALIRDSNFTLCSSLIGGSIFYNTQKPQIVYQFQVQTPPYLVGFLNNTAEIYGKNIGSYPRDFFLIDGKSEEKNQIVKQNNDYLLENLRSGELISFQIQMVDEESNPISIRQDCFFSYPSFIKNILSEFSIKIQIIPPVNEIEISDQTYADLTNYVSQNKTWSFANLKITSNADYQGSGKEALLQLTCYGVKKLDNLEKVINDSYSKTLKVKFRECKKGEVLNSRNSISECIPCPNGSYSMEQPVSSQFIECKTCPLEAYQCEKDQIFLREGYWKNNNSLNIYHCYNRPENCMGSYQGNRNYCSEGFVGALCESCDSYGLVWGQKYMKSGQFNCDPCVDAQSYYFVFPIVVFLVLIVFYVVFSINNAIKISKQLSQAYYFKKIGVFNLGRSQFRFLAPFLAKQLMHFLQICELINSYKLALPYYFVVLTNVISQPITNFQYVLDCFFVSNQSIQHDSHYTISTETDHTVIPLVFMRAIWNLCIPIIILILVSIVYSILFCIKAVQYKHFYAYNGVFFLMIFLQPNIVSSLISIVSCKKIDGISYINSDSNYECYTREHIKYSLIILLPTLILWVIIIPLFILSRLIVQRKNLQCISTRLKFGFLYQEFKSNYFYWEFVKSYKKILLVIIYNFGQDFFYLKSCLMLVVLFIYYLSIIKRAPYQLKSFNNTDRNLIICMLFILVMNIILKDTDIVWITITGEFFTALFTICVMGCMIIQIIFQKIYSIIPNKIYSLQMFLKRKLPLLMFWVHPKKPLNAIRAFKNWKKVKNCLLTKGFIKQNNEKSANISQKESTSLPNQVPIPKEIIQQNVQNLVIKQIQSIKAYTPNNVNAQKLKKQSNKPIQFESSSSQEFSNSDLSCSEQGKNDGQEDQSVKQKQKNYIKQATNNLFISDYQEAIQNNSNTQSINDIFSNSQFNFISSNLLTTSNANHQKGVQILSNSSEKSQLKRIMNGESIESSQIEMFKLLNAYPSILNHKHDMSEVSQPSHYHLDQTNSPSQLNSNSELKKINRRSYFKKNLDHGLQDQNAQFNIENINEQMNTPQKSNQNKQDEDPNNDNNLIKFDDKD